MVVALGHDTRHRHRRAAHGLVQAMGYGFQGPGQTLPMPSWPKGARCASERLRHRPTNPRGNAAQFSRLWEIHRQGDHRAPQFGASEHLMPVLSTANDLAHDRLAVCERPSRRPHPKARHCVGDQSSRCRSIKNRNQPRKDNEQHQKTSQTANEIECNGACRLCGRVWRWWWG